jgi:hypothetical protein
VLLRQVEEQRVQRRPFLFAQRSEELLFDFSGERSQGAERPPSLRGDQHEMAAPILWIAASLDEPSLLELVEQADELTAVIAESIGDRALSLV